jgi:hypothetical protein
MVEIQRVLALRRLAVAVAAKAMAGLLQDKAVAAVAAAAPTPEQPMLAVLQVNAGLAAPRLVAHLLSPQPAAAGHQPQEAIQQRPLPVPEVLAPRVLSLALASHTDAAVAEGQPHKVLRQEPEVALTLDLAAEIMPLQTLAAVVEAAEGPEQAAMAAPVSLSSAFEADHRCAR